MRGNLFYGDLVLYLKRFRKCLAEGISFDPLEGKKRDLSRSVLGGEGVRRSSTSKENLVLGHEFIL